MSPVRLLLIDDDLRLTAMVGDYLRGHGFEVETAGSLSEGRSRLRSGDFGALVLDLMLPDGDGLDLTRELRADARLRRLPLLMLTARGEPMDRVVGLELGADDYLAKPFEPRELLLRVSTILRRTGRPVEVQKHIVHMGACRFDAERGELTRDGRPVKLTSAELQLMRHLAAKSGQTFSRTELSNSMGAVLERTVDVQITRLRRKIEVDPKLPLYLQTVRGVGYVLMPDRVG
jgi:two-component system phosphate regulon response regulator OmpR